LHLGKVEYGWVMGAFGIGATIAAASLSKVSQRSNRLWLMGFGCLMMTIALLMAQGSSLGILMLLWSLAGAGQSAIDLSMQMLIADRISVELQGRVYGAHFAWSHLWWVMAYPIAGTLSQSPQQPYFFISGSISLGLLIVVALIAKQSPPQDQGVWHEHSHSHDLQAPQTHGHFHASQSKWHHHYHFHSVEHSIDHQP
jgi:MFS transporter, NRE family, putaive nickel resistance protein